MGKGRNKKRNKNTNRVDEGFFDNLVVHNQPATIEVQDQPKKEEPEGKNSISVDSSNTISAQPEKLNISNAEKNEIQQETCKISILLYFVEHIPDIQLFVPKSNEILQQKWISRHILLAEAIVVKDNVFVFKPRKKVQNFLKSLVNEYSYENSYYERRINLDSPGNHFYYCNIVTEKFDSVMGLNGNFRLDQSAILIEMFQHLPQYCKTFETFRILLTRYVARIVDIRSKSYYSSFYVPFNTIKELSKEIGFLYLFSFYEICDKRKAINFGFDINFSINEIKQCIQELSRYPEYIPVVKDLLSKNTDKVGLKYYLLYLILSTENNNEKQKYINEYKLITHQNLNFSKEEIQFIEDFPKDEITNQTLISMCSHIAMASEIGIQSSFINYLLTRASKNEINAYANNIIKFSMKQYLNEWQTCFDYIATNPGEYNLLPFTFETMIFNFTRSISSIESVFLQSVLKSSNRNWINNFLSQLIKLLKRNNSLSSFIGEIYELCNIENLEQIHLYEIHKLLNNDCFNERMKKVMTLKDKITENSKYFIELEKKWILKQMQNFTCSDLEYYHGILQKRLSSKDEFILAMYSTIWCRLIQFYERQCKTNHIVSNFYKKIVREQNDNTKSDLYICTENKNIFKLFSEAKNNLTFSDHENNITDHINNRVSILFKDIEILKRKIQDYDILPSFESIHFTNVEKIGILDKDINNLYEEYKKQKENWDNLIDAFKIMRECDQFTLLASKQLKIYEDERILLDNKTIKYWKAPDCDSSFIETSETLKKLNTSKIFKNQIWSNENIGKSIQLSVDNLVDDWVQYFQLYLDEYQNYLDELYQGNITIDILENIFSKLLFNYKELQKLKQQKESEAELRSEVKKITQRNKNNLKNLLDNEIKLYNDIFKTKLEFKVIFNNVSDSIEAIDLSNDIIAIYKLCLKLNIKLISENFKLFSDLFNDENKKNTKVNQLLCIYRNIIIESSEIRDIIIGYPVLYNNVMYKNNLLETLAKFPDIRSFNHRIDNRQSEDIRPETHDNLQALRIVGQEILSHSLFNSIKSNNLSLSKTISFKEFIDYLIQTSSTIVALFVLENSRESFQNSLESEVEEKQTIAIVKNLLVNGGCFKIKVENGKVDIYAEHKYHNNLNELHISTITSEELQALPSQLLLTSGVTKTNIDNWDIDSPLPANISKIEDRACYVLRFNCLFDKTMQLGKIIKQLNESGDIKFQNNLLTIDCKIKINKLDEGIKLNEERLLRWNESFNECREKNPLLSILSRCQIVTCLPAIQNKNKNLLFSILQSIGCDRNKMQKTLQNDLNENIQIQQTKQSATFLFLFLNNLIEKYFDTFKYNNQIIPKNKENNIFNSFSSKYKLLRIDSNYIEQVICGIHINNHNRVPSSIEILFCTSTTSLIDIEDFLDRWKLFEKITKILQFKSNNQFTFWLVNFENLSYSIQIACIRKIQNIISMKQYHITCNLFLITNEISNELSNSYIYNSLLHNTFSISNKDCENFRENIFSISKNMKNVFVVHSSQCCYGKSETVKRKLVLDQYDEKGREILHCMFSIDSTPIQYVLQKLNHHRPLIDDRGIVLHFNIGHQGSNEKINLFLYSYIFIGSWRDEFGFTHPRHENDIIVIELCNTGLKDERERISITKYFNELQLINDISYNELIPIQSDFSNIFYTYSSNVSNETGVILLILIYKEMKQGNSKFPDDPFSIWNNDIQNENLVQIIDSLYCLQMCNNNHLMERELNNNHEEIKCSCCEKSGSIRKYFFICNKCKFFVCDICSGNPSFSLHILRRYFNFAINMFQKLFTSFYQFSSGDIEGNLAFYYGRFILESVKKLSDPAVKPFDANHPIDDVRRCEEMNKFKDWRDDPFFISDGNAFRLVSLSDKSPLKAILEHEKDNSVIEKINLNDEFLKPVNRDKLHFLANEINNEAFSSNQNEPPLKELFESLGIFNCGYHIFNAIEPLNKYSSEIIMENNQIINSIDSSIKDSFNYLLQINYINDLSDIITGSDLKRVFTHYLNDLFGTDKDKPKYTLTTDNILRLLAIQIRLSCNIPVCIMGETGCGKTETIHFLSNLTGNLFKVINIQEGMSEIDIYNLMKPIIQLANENKDKKLIVLLDEVNATYSSWTAKDLLCDHIILGERIPLNIIFNVILNPWKERNEKQEKAIAEMDVGGLDFSKYQQQQTILSSSSSTQQQQNTQKQQQNLVYQVHKVPETLYSFIWDWGTAAETFTPKNELLKYLNGKIMISNDHDDLSDEFILATNMVSSLIEKLDGISDLKKEFKNAGDGTFGDNYWIYFRSILVELLLESQKFIRHDVYLDELSAVSLRDIRKACSLIWFIFNDILLLRERLNPKYLPHSKFPHFELLTDACSISLICTYCLRLDSTRRYNYLSKIHDTWNKVRNRLNKINNNILHDCFLKAPQNLSAYEKSELYECFDELASFIIKDFDIDDGIAINQALKENSFAVLCSVCTNSTLFIVGRPGSTKSRTLELLCSSTENITAKGNKSFLYHLGIIIQKHVIQCSPYTTAHHVHSNALKAARAQIAAKKLQNLNNIKRINVLVLEEVGATINSIHNPLMSLHGMIDHGIEVDNELIKIPIIGISNYRLDASKMGRGRIVYRGNPPIHDLEKTAKAILLGLGQSTTINNDNEWIKNFSFSFNENILNNEKFTWYHGMRDFYATISTLKNLSNPMDQFIEINHLMKSKNEFNYHVARWAILINLRGYPDKKEELHLANIMNRSFGNKNKQVIAKWLWKNSNDNSNLSYYLCDCCAKMQIYKYSQIYKVNHYNDDDFNENSIKQIISNKYMEHISHKTYCNYFDNEIKKNDLHFIPSSEIISYSLQEYQSRHIMIFTKANAALYLLFSLQIVKKEESTVIFQPSNSNDISTSSSELVQQMMRIKACLREGKTLILVKARHLYESLLDALNVHYIKDHSNFDSNDNLHKTVLSMAGVTQSVFVQPTFRCIILEDQDELRSYVLPPMINRFSKVILTYESALSIDQNYIKAELSRNTIIELNDNIHINLLQYLIPNITEESINAAICNFSTNDPDLLYKRLCFCISHKNVRRFSLKLVEGLDIPSVYEKINYWQNLWSNTGCSKLRNSCIDLISKDMYNCQHLMILTEQLCLNQEEIINQIRNIFEGNYDSEDDDDDDDEEDDEEDDGDVFIFESIHILNQITSKDVEAALFELKKRTDTSVVIFIIDSTSLTQSVILDSFIYTISTESLKENHHVILLSIVSDQLALQNEKSKKNQEEFSLIFDNNWGVIYADEIIPKNSLYKLFKNGNTLAHFEKDIFLHEMLKHDDLITHLLHEKDILTKLSQELSNSSKNIDYYIQLFTKIFSIEKQQEDKYNQLKNSFIQLILYNISKKDISFEYWAKLAILNAKYTSDSLCSIYIDYLCDFIFKILYHILSYVMKFNSFELILNNENNDHLQENLHLFKRLIQFPNILPNCDIESLLTSPLVDNFNIKSKINEDYFINNRFGCNFSFMNENNENKKYLFPLSPIIIKILMDCGNHYDQMNQIINQLELNQTSNELLDNYIKDSIYQGIHIPSYQLNTNNYQLIKSIIQLFHPDTFQSILNYHTFLCDNFHWFIFVLKFSCFSFSPIAVGEFIKNPSFDNLFYVASKDNIIPFHRITYLSNVLKDSNHFNWNLIRIIGIIDSLPENHSNHNSKRILSKLYIKFNKNPIEGLKLLFSENIPSSFFKYFLSELQNIENIIDMESICILIDLIAKKIPDNQFKFDENLYCGISFVLNFIIHYFLIDFNSNLFEKVESFINSSLNHYILFSHCFFNFLLKDDPLLILHDEIIKNILNLPSQSSLSILIRLICSNSLYYYILEYETEKINHYLQVIDKLLIQKNEIREFCLFIIRKKTNGGTNNNIDKSIEEIKNENFSSKIKSCQVLDEISNAILPVSPLLCIPDFKYSIQLFKKILKNQKHDDDHVIEFYKLPNCNQFSFISSLCLSVIDLDVKNFKENYLSLLSNQLESNDKLIVNQLVNNKYFGNLHLELKELFVFMLFLFSNSKKNQKNSIFNYYYHLAKQFVKDKMNVNHYKRLIEETLNPTCPRCKNAFKDWEGCFAVVCNCGCGFCGYCLQDCGSDAHHHVATVHGNYSSSFNVFRQNFGKIATNKIKSILSTIPANLKNLIDQEIPKIIQGNDYFIKPEHLIHQNHQNQKDQNQLHNDEISPTINILLSIISSFSFIFYKLETNTDDIDSFSVLFDEINVQIDQLNQYLFDNNKSNTLSTYKWIHGVLYKIENTNEENKNYSKVILSNLIQNLIKNQDTISILTEFQSICNPPTGIMKELQITEKELLNDNNNHLSTTKLSLLGLSRSEFDKHQFWEHVKANFDRYPLLNIIHENKSSIKKKYIYASCRMVKFIEKICLTTKKNEITKKEAKIKGSFYDLLHKNKDVFSNEEIIQFEKDFLLIFPKINAWECTRTIQESFQFMKNGIPNDISLEFFLPSKDGDGSFANMLWSGREGDKVGNWTTLPNIQNRIYSTIYQNNNNNSIEEDNNQSTVEDNNNLLHYHDQYLSEFSPFNFSSENITNDPNVIHINYNQILSIVESLFIIYDYHPKLSKDLHIIEQLCKYGSPKLALYPPLKIDLPEFKYSIHEGLYEIFQSISNRLIKLNKKFEPLPSCFGSSLSSLIHELIHVADMIYSYCYAILIQITSQPLDNLPNELSNIDIQIPLTEEQEQGRKILSEIPSFQSKIFLYHLPALMAFCWSKKLSKNKFHKSADCELNDNLRKEIKNGFHQLIFKDPLSKTISQYHSKIPTFLASFRICGLVFGTRKIDNADYDVSFLLTLNMDIDDLLEDLYVPPFSVPCKYLASILAIAEDILGKEEFNSAPSTSLQNRFAIRPLLKPIEVKQQMEIVEQDNAIVEQESIAHFDTADNDPNIELFDSNDFDVDESISLSYDTEIDLDF